MSGTVKTPQKFAATLSTDPAIREIQTYLLQQNQSVLNNPILAAADWRWAQDGDVFALQFRTPPQSWNTVAEFNSSGELSTDSGDGADGYVPLSLFTTAGDLPVGTGAGAVTRLGSGAVGTVLSGNGLGVAPSYQAGGGLPAITAANEGWHLEVNTGAAAWGNRNGVYQAGVSVARSLRQMLVAPGAIVFTAVGCVAQTLATPGSAAQSNNAAGFTLIRMHTSAAAGSIAGQTFLAGDAYANVPSGLQFGAHILTRADITASRIWVALANASVGSQAPPTTAAANATVVIGFAYDSAVNSGKWLLVSGDGTNWSGSDTGVTVVAGTHYRFFIAVDGDGVGQANGITGYVESGFAAFTVLQNKLAKTTNPPTNTLLGPSIFVESREAVSKSIEIARYTIEF